MAMEEKYVYKVELDTRGALSKYEKFLKDMSRLDKKYSSQGFGNRGTGRAPRNTASKSFSDSQTAANMRENLSRSSSALNRINVPGLDISTSNAINNLISRIKVLNSQIASAKTREHVAKLKAEYRQTTSEVGKLVRSQQKLNNSITLGSIAGKKLTNSFRHAAIELGSFYAILNTGRTIFRVGKELDSLRAALLGASSGAQEAEENFQFLKDTSLTYGKDVTVLVRGFNKIGAGARAMGMELGVAKDIFLAASEASTAYGLSTERTELIMLAFGQMMSKGRVSMEELGRQLGEHIPAIDIAAKSMDMTSKEFIKLVETGNVVAQDFLPKFAKELRKTVRENGSLVAGMDKLEAKQQRMITTLKLLVDKVFQGRGAQAIGNLFQKISKFVEFITPVLSDIGNGFFEIFDIVVELTSSIVQLANAVMSLGLPTKSFRREWSLVKSLFASIGAVIWEVIGGIHTLRSLLSGDTSLINNSQGQFAGLGGFLDDPLGAIKQDFQVLFGAKDQNPAQTNNYYLDNVSISSNTPDEFVDSLGATIAF